MTAQPDRELATLGGGCFWCLEAVYKDLKGVESVVSGYAGGHVENPSYEQVCGGRTGHAEVVQIAFDPQVVTYRDLLDVFFTIHDPTTKDRQGADVGPQYRSIVLYHSPEQKAAAERGDRRPGQQGHLASADRHRDRAARDVLPGRGVPPRLLRAEPAPALLPDHHRSQGRQVPQGTPRQAQAIARAAERCDARVASAAGPYQNCGGLMAWRAV